MVLALPIPALTVQAQAQVPGRGWQGDWSSSFGQLRLLQEGDRVYGDYADTGTIEGRVGPDGRTLRGVFLYDDRRRWGTVEWVREGDRFEGSWRWNREGITWAGDQAWSGTRSAADPSPLRYAARNRDGVPDDVNFSEGPFEGFLTFADAVGGNGGGTPAACGSGGGRVGCVLPPDPSPVPDPTPTRTRDGVPLGEWYAGFDAANVEPFDVGADILHLSRGDTGDTDVFLFAPAGGCPRTMHTAFCAELRAAAEPSSRPTTDDACWAMSGASTR